jgi:DNA-binding NtrC family response regulator
VGGSVARDELERLLASAEALRGADAPADAATKLAGALRFEGPLDPLSIAEIRLKLADCYSDANDHVAAQQALVPLLADPPDDLSVARAKVRLARAKYFFGDVEAAIDLCRDGLRVLARSNDPGETAVALKRLGIALQEAGRNAEADEAIRDAVALARLADDKAILASCLGSAARVNVQRSRYRAARAQYEDCLVLAEAAGHRKEVARDHLNLSVCSFYLGEWERSERETRRALRLYRELGDKRGMALCELALGRLARRRGSGGSRHLRQAASLAEECGFRRARLLVIEERAELEFERGNFAEAAAEYEKLRELATPEAPGGDISYEVRWRLALVRHETGRTEEAERLATEALADAERAGDERETALCMLALARLHRSARPEDAAREVERAIRILEKLETPYELVVALESATGVVHLERARQIRRELRIENEPKGKPVEIVALEPSSRRLVSMARRLAAGRTPILIRGETGVGKTLLARLIHESGPRAAHELTILRCAGWSETRAETGQAPDPSDLFQRAARGTVVLDGLGAASAALQRRLVAAWDGAGEQGPRVITTVSEDPGRLPLQGGVLKELWYRIGGLVLEIPPLRTRPADLRRLAEVFAGGPLSPDVVEALSVHSWPGNVTELGNVIAFAKFQAGEKPITRRHLPELIGDDMVQHQGLPEKIQALERREIARALEQTGNNKRAAAKALGISRKGLIDRLKRLEMWSEFGRTEREASRVRPPARRDQASQP